ncbi:hypothetical protein D3C73_1501840 [compost metagenome]
MHHNPLLGVGIAVAFAVVLGIVVDHALRWWHKYLEKKDVAREAAASSEVKVAEPADLSQKAVAGADLSKPAG